jgi:hypothetical protein
LKVLTKSFAVAILTGAMGLTSILPAAAAVPMPIVKHTQIGNVEDVQWRRPVRRGWYNGHRGYRGYHRGYRRHSDGFWYPLAAFGAGAIIGGAITAPRAYAGSNRHVQWCSERYRTYRASDNTYVPRAGVRAQCNSPYN